MPDSDEPDEPTAPTAAPSRANGCWLAAGAVLSMVGGFAAAVGAMALNAPFGVVAAVMFGVPGLYIAVVIGYVARHVWKTGSGADADPMQRATARVALPVVGAFFAVAALSFGGVIAAHALGAPGWALPFIFFGPPVLMTVLSWPYLKGLAERMKRAAPSPERAAALAATPPARRTEPVAQPTDPDTFPTVPADPSEPGTRLARALPPADLSAGCACLGILLLMLFWNGIVSVFLWQVVQAFQKGKPEWFLAVFLIPFVLVGLALVAGFVFAAFAWVVSLLAGKIVVEVDAHPFVPGGRYEGHVRQAGLFRLTKVGVELACEEAATYQAGTTESTDKKVVAKHPAELPEPLPAAPTGFVVVVPADAMHSFEAAKNRITWTVVVWGRVLGVLPYSRAFVVVVHPGAGDV